MSVLSRGSTGRAAMLLTIGRTAGFAVAFAIPIVLARCLTQESFGIYKYLFLLYSTLGFMQVGMAESLYFFVPRSKEDAGPAVTNAVLTLVGSGLACAAVLAGGAWTVARLSGNPTIAPYLPVLGIFLALMLVAMPLEIVMVSRKRYGLAALTYAGSDTVRAAALILPGILTRNLYMLLVGVTAFAVLRCVAMVWYLFREFGRELRVDRSVWKAQFAYALPFAAAVVIETLQINLHQYVVWAKFDAAAFAIYSVGCLQIPLVDLLATSTANVMMVRMCEEPDRAPQGRLMWNEAVTRLAFVFIPLVVALLLTGRDLMTALFTVKYAASTPIFLVSTVMIALASFPVDAVLRVYAATGFLVVMNLIRLAVIGVGISWCIHLFGLPGAILITVFATFVSKTVAVWRIAHLFGVGWRVVLPWRALAITVALAAVSVVPAMWVHARLESLTPLFRGGLSASFYGIVYVGAAGLVRLLGHETASGLAPDVERSKSIV